MSIGFQVIVGLVSIGLFVFCDYTITRWAELLTADGVWTWRLAWVVIAAPLSALCFGLVGARMGLAAVSAYINTGIVVGGVLLGMLLRAERLTEPQKIGVILGFLAMLLLNLGKAPPASPFQP
jgi:drug/metabolite transporter (DMT)-like permease